LLFDFFPKYTRQRAWAPLVLPIPILYLRLVAIFMCLPCVPLVVPWQNHSYGNPTLLVSAIASCQALPPSTQAVFNLQKKLTSTVKEHLWTHAWNTKCRRKKTNCTVLGEIARQIF
jgi:hypothetical protein